ncbi:hypothetical protein I204_05268 [Kwoniella mangroviensis CBS 8886]|uniref:uncharacterized protein n=1 Tax=Kwoniella mangroviensis CBS 8507 TaxID=1296122 RepID=UPI00080D8004|nr:uncharacterized protein I203_04621 [Kwoniella mangroviensis CBS 8507]OCF66290.1 hypothetical protein I203_04621 [Kwoniella mangroviensis CBS 8507]OCF73427.1 hypothetical protein I204_05268 [Kwoniella mangroviensis CBS 8886]
MSNNPPLSPSRELYSPIKYPLPPSPSPWRRALSLVAVPSIHRTTSAFGSRRDKDRRRQSFLNDSGKNNHDGNLTDGEDIRIRGPTTPIPGPPQTVNPFPEDHSISYDRPLPQLQHKMTRSMSLPFSSGETDISMINHYPNSSITSLDQSVDTSVPRTEFFSTFEETPTTGISQSQTESESESQSPFPNYSPSVDEKSHIGRQRDDHFDGHISMGQPTSNLDTPPIPVPQDTIQEGVTPTPTPSLSALKIEYPFFHIDARLSREPVPISDVPYRSPLTGPPIGADTRPRGMTIAPLLPLPPSPSPRSSSSVPFPPFLPFPYVRSPPLGVNPNSMHPPSPTDYLTQARSAEADALFSSTAPPEIFTENTSIPPAPPIDTSSKIHPPPGVPIHISPSPPSLPNIPHIVWLPISPNSAIPPPIIPGFREGRPLSSPLPTPLPSHRPPVSPTSQSHVGGAAVPPTPQVQHPSEVRSSQPRNVVLPDGRELIAMTAPNGETAYMVDPLPAILRTLDRDTAEGTGNAEGEGEFRCDNTIAASAPVPSPTRQGAEEPLGLPHDVPTAFSTVLEPPRDLSQIERELYELSFPPPPAPASVDNPISRDDVGHVRRPRVLSEGRASLNSPRRGVPKFDWRRKFKIPSSASASDPSEIDIPRPQPIRRDEVSTLAVQDSATTTHTDTWSVSEEILTSTVEQQQRQRQREEEKDIWWVGVGEKHHDPSGDLIIAERECRWRISMQRFKRDSQLISHLSECPTKGMTLTLQAPSLPCQASRPSSSSSGSAFDIISVFLNYLLTHDMKDLKEVENVDQFESLFILCDFFGCPAVYQNLLRYIDESGVNGITPWQLFVIASRRDDTTLAKIALRLSSRTRITARGHRDKWVTLNVHQLNSKDVKDVRSTWVLELFKERYEKMLDGRFREVPWEIVAERFNPC